MIPQDHKTMYNVNYFEKRKVSSGEVSNVFKPIRFRNNNINDDEKKQSSKKSMN